MRKPVNLGGAVIAFILAALVGIVLIIVQALVRLVSRRRS